MQQQNTQQQNVVVENNKAAVVVGKNDKVAIATESKTASKPLSTSERIKQLVAERKVWEHGAYVKSNEQLYALLGKCYAFYFDLRGNDKEAKAAREELNTVISTKGYSFNEGTHVLAKLVKYVFEGVDRRRVSAYSLVLREALARGVKADGIPAFITSGGGVEEIRRSKSKTAKTAKQKAALGKEALKDKELAVFNSETLATLAQQADKSVGDDVVAILTQREDGSFVVRELIGSTSLLKAALACAYSKNKIVGKNDNAANDDKLEDLLNDAAMNG